MAAREVGLVGTLLYLGAIGAAVGAVVRLWTSSQDEIGVAVAAAVVGAAAVYIAAALYSAPWNTDATTILFWGSLGMAVKWGRLAVWRKTNETGERRVLGLQDVRTRGHPQRLWIAAARQPTHKPRLFP